MMQHQQGVHELLAEDRQLAEVEAHFPAKRGRGGVSARDKGRLFTNWLVYLQHTYLHLQSLEACLLHS